MSDDDISKLFDKLEAMGRNFSDSSSKTAVAVARMEEQIKALSEMKVDVHRAHARIDSLRNIGSLVAAGLTAIGTLLGVTHK